MKLRPEDIQAWITAGSVLISAGTMLVGQLESLVRLFHTNLSEEDLNAIILGIQDDAARRAALAHQDRLDAEAAAAASEPNQL